MSEVPSFHILLHGPDDTVFPSIKNTDVGNGKLDGITLTHIRQICKASKKYKFTSDGKTSIADNVTLEYYVSLTPDNRSKFEKPANGAPLASDGQVATNSVVADTPSINVQLILEKQIDRPARPDLDSNFQKIKDALKGIEGLDPQKVESLAGSIGKRLADSVQFEAKANADVFSPADLTESQWQVILFNNRALHGWVYKQSDDKRSFILRRAPKRAFEIKRSVPASLDGTLEKNYYDGIPGTPSFTIDDDAGVTVTEIGNAFQQRLAKEGFTSNTISSSANFGQAVSISASYEQEQKMAATIQQSENTNALHVSYNFPRVTVSFVPETIQLSAECRRDALNVTNDDEKKEFYDKYGDVFATKISLGGRLQHSKTITQEEKGKVSVIKDRMQAVAGASFSAPYVSAAAVYGHAEGTQSADEVSALNRSLAMSWEARGGDTTLCSNPPLWASTVKNHQYWRLLNQSLTVDMYHYIKSVDPEVAINLHRPQRDKNINPISNENMREIAKAFQIPGYNDALANKVRDYYNSTFDRIKKEYNQLQGSWGSNGPNAPIQDQKWSALAWTQKFGVGFYMAYKGLLFNRA